MAASDLTQRKANACKRLFDYYCVVGVSDDVKNDRIAKKYDCQCIHIV